MGDFSFGLATDFTDFNLSLAGDEDLEIGKYFTCSAGNFCCKQRVKAL